MEKHLNSASPTTQAYPGARKSGLPICDLPAMSATIAGVEPEDQKVGRQLQVHHDRKRTETVQRTPPGSIVRIPSAERTAVSFSIVDVDFDPAIGDKQEQEQASALDNSLKALTDIDVTEKPRCAS